jgi:hypothetical protein
MVLGFKYSLGSIQKKFNFFLIQVRPKNATSLNLSQVKE